MIDYDQAFALVCARASPLGSEHVPIREAHGRFLSEPVIAQVDAPPADVSAMDGYAVCGEGDQYRVVGTSYPGAAFEGQIVNGECVRIFTGAPMPSGGDRVIIQEIAVRDGNLMRINAPPGQVLHVRSRGADFKFGQDLLQPGDQLTDRAMVVAAGANLDRLVVGRRPKVAVLATGDELSPPGQARSGSGHIPESISYGLSALLEQYGANCMPVILVPDDQEATTRAAEQALAAADLVLITGGASVGEKDFAKPVFNALGLESVFTKVAMKPGKPVWFGHVQGKPVMGLPGNPTSAYVTARLLLTPLVAGMAGGRPAGTVRWARAALGGELPACGDRETFTRGAWQGDEVIELPYQDSGSQLTLASAQLLIRQPAGTPARRAGAEVRFLAL